LFQSRKRLLYKYIINTSMKRRTVISTAVSTTIAASLAGCSDGNGNGENESSTPTVEAQARNSYDFEATLNYSGKLVQKQDGDTQEQEYEFNGDLTGFVDEEAQKMYYNLDWETTTEDSQKGSIEYYFDNGSEYSKNQNQGSWTEVSFGAREEFSNVHLAGHRVFEDVDEEFDLDSTNEVTTTIEIQDVFYYDPILMFFGSEFDPTEATVEYQFNSETGNMTDSTILVDSAVYESEDYEITVNNMEENCTYSDLSEYEEPDIDSSN